MAPAAFFYAPLPSNHIRLLEITTERGKLPGLPNQHRLFDPEDVLVFQLVVAHLDDPPLYEALSYTWGNPLTVFETRRDWEQAEKKQSSKVPILCDRKLLCIGFSLYEVLNALRWIKRNHSTLDITSQEDRVQAVRPESHVD